MSAADAMISAATHGAVHVVVTCEGPGVYDWSRADVPAADGVGYQRHRISAPNLRAALDTAIDAVGESVWSSIAFTFAHAMVTPRTGGAS